MEQEVDRILDKVLANLAETDLRELVTAASRSLRLGFFLACGLLTTRRARP